MLLQVLNEYATRKGLVESIELIKRTIHLVLKLRPDGSVEPGSPWLPLTTEQVDTSGKVKVVPGAQRTMPRFPGENNGGKAHFLADSGGAVLGVEPKTGAALPDDPKVGKNATKAFLHFWRRIEEAHAETKSADLAALLAFRDRRLGTPESREGLEFLGWAEVGKSAKRTFCALTEAGPVPLEGKAITFAVGGEFLFKVDPDGPPHPLHAYWSAAYRREAFADEGDAEGLGLCLVTGRDGQPIAGSHKPEIKGVPGLPPKGGYLVSFARESPAFGSYGFEGSRNAPVSEQAVAGYALALNDLLQNPRTARRLSGGFVLTSWLRDHPDEAGAVWNLLEDPTPDEVREYLGSFEEGRPRHGLREDRYYSLTLAANGGRVVVRRWIDEALGEVVDHLKSWFADLEIDVIEPPSSADKAKTSKGTKPGLDRPKAPPYRALGILARMTARTAEDVRADVYDALTRAALEGRAPSGLLAPTLHRLRIAAVESGRKVGEHTARFALLKLILIRTPKGDDAMSIGPRLCEATADSAYNSGRLLAVLDDLQAAAQGAVGADVLARYYGRASTVPRNVFPSLIQLAQSHLKKLGGEKPGLAVTFDRRIADILAHFDADGPAGCPDFPGLMTVQQQGRFALGFYQQKAADFREQAERKAAKKAESSPAEDR